MKSLKYKIGIHFTDVKKRFFFFVEQLLRKGKDINILFTTNNLSEGMNLPTVWSIVISRSTYFKWKNDNIRQIMGRTNRLSCKIDLVY
jgi:replicative superfamily II helicase